MSMLVVGRPLLRKFQTFAAFDSSGLFRGSFRIYRSSRLYLWGISSGVRLKLINRFEKEKEFVQRRTTLRNNDSDNGWRRRRSGPAEKKRGQSLSVVKWKGNNPAVPASATIDEIEQSGRFVGNVVHWDGSRNGQEHKSGPWWRTDPWQIVDIGNESACSSGSRYARAFSVVGSFWR